MVDVSHATILIVEDDPGVLLLERRRLERAGYTVVSAVAAGQALDCLKKMAVDLILLDYRLPDDVDGLDFYGQVRAAGFDLPVILVTGFSNEAMVIKALRAGVRDFVAKSTEFLEYLPEAVAQVLRQVRTENQLVESEARLAALIHSAKDAIILADSHSDITLFNPAAESMFQCPAEAALGQPIRTFLPFALAAADSLAESSNRLQTEGQGIRRGGAAFPVEASVSPVQAAGRIFFNFVIRDVSDRKQAEQARQDSERQFRQIWEKSRDGMRLTDPQGRILLVNEAYCQLVKKTRQELEGQSFTVVYAQSFGDALLDNYRRGFYARSIEPSQTRELVLWNDQRICFELSNSFLEMPGPTLALLSIQRDVTEKKNLENQFRQVQKMEAIGLLAGGIAHDFNNLLTVISGFSELMLNTGRLDASTQEFVKEIRKAGERAATLTRQLLAFSRKQMLQPQVMDLNALLEETQKMLLRLIGADVSLAASLDPELGWIKADPGQIEQVLLNLVVNARDAMPRGGHLTIETRNVDIDEDYVRHHLYARPGRHVLLAVTDTGCGMTEEIKARIFEPFFTTKKVGKGTGLGLSTVFGIVKQSNGHIEVYSEVGRGTTFKIYLPRVPRGSSASLAAVMTSIPNGTETVLVAEDEEGVRSLVRLALVSYGYTVLEGKNGAEALEAYRKHGGPVQLLVTDVVMPRMSGRQLADELTQQQPNLKVLFLSGYTDDAVVRHGLVEAGMPFLQKPFTPTMVARKVREALDGPQGA